jgi:hypothetical protein
MDTKNKIMDLLKVNHKKIQVAFDEPEITSDAGALLVGKADEAMRLAEQLAAVVKDKRGQGRIDHTVEDMLRQRLTQICLGYPDADDCDHFRADPALKAAVGRLPSDPALASQPTMTRLENSVSRKDLLRLANVFGDLFIQSFDSPPEAVIIDLDPTVDLCHGMQEMSLFNGWVGERCLMPLHVYDGITGRLITTVLRPGKTPLGGEIITVLKRIVRRLRAAWPDVVLILRADSHFSKPEIMDWCDGNGVEFILGLGGNSALDNRHDIQLAVADAKRLWPEARKAGGESIRRFVSFSYAAGTWSAERRVVAKISANEFGVDTRFVVTSLEAAGAKYLYETVYCGRGNMELMIMDHKTGLESDRTSCTSFKANQFRLLIHSAAYVAMGWIREKLLAGTEYASARFATIRTRLLKIGARVEEGKTYVRFHLPTAFPHKEVFAGATAPAPSTG